MRTVVVILAVWAVLAVVVGLILGPVLNRNQKHYPRKEIE